MKREVCFAPLAWMPACAGMTHFNEVNPFQFLALLNNFNRSYLDNVSLQRNVDHLIRIRELMKYPG